MWCVDGELNRVLRSIDLTLRSEVMSFMMGPGHLRHLHRGPLTPSSRFRVKFKPGPPTSSTSTWLTPPALFQRLNWAWILSPQGANELRVRGVQEDDLSSLRDLWKDYSMTHDPDLQSQLVQRALRLPNTTSPQSLGAPPQGKVLTLHGTPGHDLDLKDKPSFKSFKDLTEPRGTLRFSNLGNLAGPRSYILRGQLAELEHALLRTAIETLEAEGFQFLTVPDLIYPDIIEACGMPVTGQRTQVYRLLGLKINQNQDTGQQGQAIPCLAGTSEMSIAGYLSNRVFQESQLPLRFAALSRCYRAEISKTEDEVGIFRVHNFTKVEMFGVTTDLQRSNDLQTQFLQIQENLFRDVSLSFRTLEMPPEELGRPAHRKFDIEAWMPGMRRYGEVSSCSNCTDFQSRRLNIRWKPSSSSGHQGQGEDEQENLQFVHTINGTAMAIPRVLISLLENSQEADGSLKPLSLLNKYPSPVPTQEGSGGSSPTRYIRPTFLRAKGQQEWAHAQSKTQ